MTADNSLRLMDADGHIVEDLSDLATFMDPAIRWVVSKDRPFASCVGAFPMLDGVHNLTRYADGGMIPKNRQRVHASSNRPGSPADWKALLDKTSLEHTVMVTSDGLGIGQLRNRDYLRLICRAYNDYVSERFARFDKRQHPLALIPMQYPSDGVEELRRAVKELGLLGAMIPSTGLQMHAAQEYYWPVYREAAELGCVLAFHGGSNKGIGLDSFSSLTASHILHHSMPLMIAFVSLVFDRVFDRFPGLRIAFLEGGCGWVAFVLDRIHRDSTFEGHYDTAGHRRLRELLEEGNILIGCEGNDSIIPYLSKTIGVKTLAFSSDYPHEADLNDVTHEIEETLESPELSRDEKAAIMGGNARAFFRL